MKNWIQKLDSTKFDTGKFSQSYQDKLLDIIFKNIGTVNPTPFCVEFGFNSTSLTEGTGSNVANLVINQNWNYLLLDGDNENPTIKLYKHFLSSSNICDIFKKYNVPKQPEYISIDVDSTELWLFKALLKEYKAMVFSVEYNCNFPLEKSITFPDDINEHWEHDRGYGASLKALTMVASEHGYSLLWVVHHLDAFFIRNDLINDGSSLITFPFKKWAYCTNWQCHRPLRNVNRLNIFIDYEEYVNTNGDIEKSRKSAYKTCKTYLLEEGDFRTKIVNLKRFLKNQIWRKVRRKILGL